MSVPMPPPPPDRSGIHPKKLEPMSKIQPSCEPLEQVVDGDFRKQLVSSVPQGKAGEWRYGFEMSSLTTAILNLIFKEAEKKGKNRHFRMYIGPGSDGSSADKLSLDLKFNPWDTAISFRPEWRPTRRTVLRSMTHSNIATQIRGMCGSMISKTFCHRPMPCVIVV